MKFLRVLYMLGLVFVAGVAAQTNHTTEATICMVGFILANSLDDILEKL